MENISAIKENLLFGYFWYNSTQEFREKKVKIVLDIIVKF